MKLTKAARKVIPCKSCGAVIVAAGSARRMAGVDWTMPPLASLMVSFTGTPGDAAP